MLQYHWVALTHLQPFAGIDNDNAFRQAIERLPILHLSDCCWYVEFPLLNDVNALIDNVLQIVACGSRAWISRDSQQAT